MPLQFILQHTVETWKSKIEGDRPRGIRIGAETIRSKVLTLQYTVRRYNSANQCTPQWWICGRNTDFRCRVLWWYTDYACTVPFRPSLRGLWPVTATKRSATLRPPSDGVTGWKSLRNCRFWKDFRSKSPENQLSLSSKGGVTRDKKTNSSLRTALWHVTEELVEMVQYLILLKSLL